MGSGLSRLTIFWIRGPAAGRYHRGVTMEAVMLFQTVLQATLRRLRSALPPPPTPADPLRPRDRTGLIVVMFLLAIALAFAISAIAP